MTRFPRLFGFAMVMAASLVACNSALASVVTVGSPLTQDFGAVPFSEAITTTNSVLPELGAHVTSPTDGVIVRWRMLDAAGGPFKLRVLRPVGGTSYIGVGRSDPETPSGPSLQTFPTDLPIKAGDTIGLDNHAEAGDQIGVFILSGSSGPFYDYWEPQLPEGIATPYKAAVEGYELAFNADVQPPPTVTAIAPSFGHDCRGDRGHDHRDRLRGGLGCQIRHHPCAELHGQLRIDDHRDRTCVCGRDERSVVGEDGCRHRELARVFQLHDATSATCARDLQGPEAQRQDPEIGQEADPGRRVQGRQTDQERRGDGKRRRGREAVPESRRDGAG